MNFEATCCRVNAIAYLAQGPKEKENRQESAWLERVAMQLHTAGLTRGGVAERTVELLQKAGVDEAQVRRRNRMFKYFFM